MNTPTDEVFLTDAPGGTQTSWRLFNGGTEFGTIFNTGSDDHFTQDAPEGHFRWQTNGLLRMQLNQTQNSVINTFTVPTDGFLGLGTSPVANTAPGNPWTRLHLHDVQSGAGVVANGFRDWMRNGVTMTGHGDQMYVGHHYGPGSSDPTDAVFQWADNGVGQQGPDLMRFIFTSAYNAAAPNGPTSLFGQEIMQLHPSGFVGIGDWFAAAATPTTRLDVLDGQVRVRGLPADPVTIGTEAVVVNMTTGVLEHRPFPAIAANCEWSLGGGANGNNVWSVVGTGTTCPNDNNNVGIGVNLSTTTALAKLHVERVLASSTGTQRTGYFNMDGGSATGSKMGVHAIATGTGTENIGLKAEGNGGATTNYGVQAQANGTGTATSPDTGTRYGVFGTSVQGAKQSFGVRSQGGWATQMTCGVRANGDHGPSGIAKPDSIFGVWATSGNSIHRSYGVYSKTGVSSGADGADGQAYGVYCESGAAVGNNTPPLQVSYALYAKRTYPGASHPNNWAGWFDGNVMINGNGYLTGMVPITSDGNLKTNVEDLEDADSLLNLLAPKRYEFLTDQFPDLALAEGEQWGFIAQEVEEVIPDLVHKVTVPAFQDSLGNQTQAAMELRTLNYIGIIPLLVAGYQEQVATIELQHAENAAQAAALDEMRNRLDQMEAALASCCANIGGGDQRATGASGAMDAVSGNTRALTIQPNPFNEQTTLYYTLERSGRMQLMANSADGKQLRVLHEASLEAGQYQHEWHTSDLSPGVYYVTLLLDGEAVVKKAVKVQR